jgi:hypothetical protein
MSVRSITAIGFFSVVAAIGMVNASNSAASETNRPGLVEERVGHGGSIYYKDGQVSGCNAAGQHRGEVVEVRVGHGGSLYYKDGQVSGCSVATAEQNGGKLVEERVGHGGSIYYR